MDRIIILCFSFDLSGRFFYKTVNRLGARAYPVNPLLTFEIVMELSFKASGELCEHVETLLVFRLHVTHCGTFFRRSLTIFPEVENRTSCFSSSTTSRVNTSSNSPDS